MCECEATEGNGVADMNLRSELHGFNSKACVGIWSGCLRMEVDNLVNSTAGRKRLQRLLN